MKFRSIALTAAAIVVFAACGGSTATNAPASAATSAPASTTPSAMHSMAPSDGMSMAPSDGHSMASDTPAASTATVTGTPVTVKDFSLDPKDLTIQGAGALAVTNAGPTVHNVAIRDSAGKVVATTKELKTGEAESLPVDLPAGAYTLFCSLPGHESLGIKGTLTVTR